MQGFKATVAVGAAANAPFYLQSILVIFCNYCMPLSFVNASHILLVMTRGNTILMTEHSTYINTTVRTTWTLQIASGLAMLGESFKP